MEGVPRVRLASLPTPLQECARLRAALGGPTACPRIFVKRDDLTGLATGGNKARKLEFTLADAAAAGATVLLTTGAVQSNHARLTAAAARAAGMRAVLVLTLDRPDSAAPAPAGNHLLDLVLGAELHFVPPAPAGPDGKVPGAENPHERERLERRVAELREAGEVPYVVPLGASDPIGTAGYATAASELEEQLRAASIRASRVYVAAGTRGTQAGLVLGAKLAGAPWRVHGIAISAGDPDKTRAAVAFTNACAERIGTDVRVDDSDFTTHQDHIGEGYGIPTAACREAIRLAARTEALILDPVYTGKAMAGLIDHVRQGRIPPDESVVFLHTGGVASVFAQASQMGVLPSP